KSGVLLATDGLLSTALGARVRRAGDKVTVTDGPFSEAKEVIGGFAIVEMASKAEVVELAKRFLSLVGDGESEIRQMYDVPAMAG
ncbi:YciI family protein, partial [Rhizobiaceae sp. 2RAB30]